MVVIPSIINNREHLTADAREYHHPAAGNTQNPKRRKKGNEPAASFWSAATGRRFLKSRATTKRRLAAGDGRQQACSGIPGRQAALLGQPSVPQSGAGSCSLPESSPERQQDWERRPDAAGIEIPSERKGERRRNLHPCGIRAAFLKPGAQVGPGRRPGPAASVTPQPQHHGSIRLGLEYGMGPGGPPGPTCTPTSWGLPEATRSAGGSSLCCLSGGGLCKEQAGSPHSKTGRRLASGRRLLVE